MSAAGQQDGVAGPQDEGLDLFALVRADVDPDLALQEKEHFLGPEDLPLDKFVAVPLDFLALGMDEHPQLLGELARGEEAGARLVVFLAQDDGVNFAVANDLRQSFHRRLLRPGGSG